MVAAALPPLLSELVHQPGGPAWVEIVAFSPSGRYALLGSAQPVGTAGTAHDFGIRLQDLESGWEVRRFEGHTNWVVSLAFSPDARHVASASYDGTVRLWDVESGKQLQCFVGHTERVRSVAFAPDGKSLLSGGYDGTLRL